MKASLVYGRNNSQLLQIRVFLGGKYHYKGLMSISPSEWNSKKSLVVKRSDSVQLNIKFKNEILKIEKYFFENPDAHFKSYGSASSSLSVSFVDLCQKEVLLKSHSSATRNNHISTFSAISKFFGSVSVNDIDIEFLQRLTIHFLGRGLAQSSINRHHQVIRSYFNIFLAKGITNNYPYKFFVISACKSDRHSLSQKELDILVSLYHDVGSVLSLSSKRVLRMFLFSCYTGLRFSDVSALNYLSIKITDGYVYVTGVSGKTSSRFSLNISLLFGGLAVGLLDPSLFGLEKAVFEGFSNVYVNYVCSILSDFVGVDFSYHISRHTFATLCLENNVDIVTTQKLMGHANINTTRIYADITNEKSNNVLKNAFAQNSKSV
jgi:site-specific recombinase XerD